MTVLITGASGTVGREIVRQMSTRGETVRAPVRDKSKARAILGDAVELVSGDYGDIRSLDRAFSGAQKVLLLAPNTPDQATLEANMVAAAGRAGARHVVELSGLGADLQSPARIARCHAIVEQTIAASGIPFTLLRPNTFMQNFLGTAAAIAAGGLRLPMGRCRVSVVDVRDIAAVAAAVLTEPGHEGMAYEITGPEALTFAEIAERLSAAVGQPIAYINITPEQYKLDLLKAGCGEWEADAIVELDLHVTPSLGAAVTDVVATVARRQPTTFAAFAREHAAAFRDR
jgi:uncharacterized protein YbjT (DUF2867 family)